MNKYNLVNKEVSHIYHEKQVKELCALHALNNLFQEENAFTKQMLDDICHSLSPGHLVNPHKSVLGLGNYDINVIMAALEMNGCETIWFDKRRSVECLVFSNIRGFILNIPTDYKWGLLSLPLKRKHWICIRQINDLYYNLDSKLDVPELIGREDDVKKYLQEQIDAKDKELILAVDKSIGQSKSWRIPDPEFSTPKKGMKHNICSTPDTPLKRSLDRNGRSSLTLMSTKTCTRIHSNSPQRKPRSASCTPVKTSAQFRGSPSTPQKVRTGVHGTPQRGRSNKQEKSPSVCQKGRVCRSSSPAVTDKRQFSRSETASLTPKKSPLCNSGVNETPIRREKQSSERPRTAQIDDQQTFKIHDVNNKDRNSAS